MVHVVDAGSFDSGNYGNGITLTNGLLFDIVDDEDTVLLDLLDGLPIMVNPDWARHCYDTAVSSYGQGNETLNARWTFAAIGTAIRLTGDEGHCLRVTIQDDLTDLEEQRIQVQAHTH